MKLAISNLAWDMTNNDDIYKYLNETEFKGIEIAPAKLFKNFPLEQIEEAAEYADTIKPKYNLEIASFQSIWFGRDENIFSSDNERQILLAHTKKVIIFAEQMHCKNIVFGCPKNRAYTGVLDFNIACAFFNEIGSFAEQHNTVIALEPNPVIYNTNFLNTTDEALAFVKKISCPGLKINLDLGTVIYNKEDIAKIFKDISLVNHIHISEPYLSLIQKRELHGEIAHLINTSGYNNWISIEMKMQANISDVKNTVQYVKSIFAVESIWH
jgi:sugar phosphate isomerase/epimerase